MSPKSSGPGLVLGAQDAHCRHPLEIQLHGVRRRVDEAQERPVPARPLDAGEEARLGRNRFESGLEQDPARRRGGGFLGPKRTGLRVGQRRSGQKPCDGTSSDEPRSPGEAFAPSAYTRGARSPQSGPAPSAGPWAAARGPAQGSNKDSTVTTELSDGELVDGLRSGMSEDGMRIDRVPLEGKLP